MSTDKVEYCVALVDGALSRAPAIETVHGLYGISRKLGGGQRDCDARPPVCNAGRDATDTLHVGVGGRQLWPIEIAQAAPMGKHDLQMHNAVIGGRAS
ncbi:hypothetical protein [Novosphingobium cyanobacteriorum]|uniref:Uncharacterized protein n=1 Tax=Novosphingobium cyanobacteriorum TaxID=3024215 RepID=A0ABT6CKN4_9SPHN|nr:hypothetical protein [Novosphingobium cyanobacteriorum]MDF8334475.1 hypothetical protein [Novosphingobium cyanobacteriorum]